MNVKTQPVQVGNLSIGDGRFILIAGPCSLESREQFQDTARHVRAGGAGLLRGGMFKLRTQSTSFQGLGREAYDLAREVKSLVQLPFVSEVTDPRQINDMADIVDMFQVGSRNMHNYALLKELGATDKPVLLKRGFSGLIKEWLAAADYIRDYGNPRVVLCERGIRTFETATRNTLDLNAVAYVKLNSSYPIIVDPSHGTGASELVIPLAKAAAAVGADGVMVEVHPRPQEALSDGYQALDFKAYDRLVSELAPLLSALDRQWAKP